MTADRRGASAYRNAARSRNAREQEADVFRRATGALRIGASSGPVERVRAIADNRRLWLAVEGLMADPTNILDPRTRAGIISLGIVVRREMDKPDPNFDFLIGINETIAAGLAGEP